MEWYDALWVGEKARKKKRSILAAVSGKKKMSDAYVIILSPNPSLLLEILPVSYMASAFIHTEDYYIIGIAGSREEAFLLVQSITDYVYRATGGLDLKGFFRR